MKRWISLLTIAIFVAAFATPVVAGSDGSKGGGGGCSPNISGANKTVSGTSGNITVAAPARLASTTGTAQTGANGGNTGPGGAGTGGTGAVGGNGAVGGV